MFIEPKIKLLSNSDDIYGVQFNIWKYLFLAIPAEVVSKRYEQHIKISQIDNVEKF